MTLLEAAAAGGELPLDYMLAVMRDPKVPAKRRDEMAKAAAPYLHSRLSAVSLNGEDGMTGTDGNPIDQNITVTFVRAPNGASR
jgi:hypothetical protein